ncbi:unnamed protein product [Caenorhabditis nigoni]
MNIDSEEAKLLVREVAATYAATEVRNAAAPGFGTDETMIGRMTPCGAKRLDTTISSQDFTSIIIYVTDGYKRAKLESKDIREITFMIPEENEKMGIMKIFVTTKDGMFEMWRVLPDACFAFKINGFEYTKFKCTPIKNWSEFNLLIIFSSKIINF